MVYPAYIPRSEVVIERGFIVESGEPLRIDFDLKASRSLLWDATREPFPSVTREERGTATGVATVLGIPPTDLDQAWRDLDTNAIIHVGEGEHSHSYLLTAHIKDAAGHDLATKTFGPFNLPSSTEPVNLFDLLPLHTVDGDLMIPPADWAQVVFAAVADAAAEADRAEAAADRAEQASRALREDPADEGTYLILDPDALAEDPTDEGTYLIGVTA